MLCLVRFAADADIPKEKGYVSLGLEKHTSYLVRT